MALDKTTPPQGDGFLSRWSQRKQALRQGLPVAEPATAPPVMQPTAGILQENQPLAPVKYQEFATENVADEKKQEPEVRPPAPTMQDVHGLTPASDFKPFMRADVSPEVKNAAMRQLFKDPHFNTMDMMDVYVDDYSKPDPLPPEMLRKMAVTQFLGFWKEEEEKEAAEKKAREDARMGRQENVAQSEPEKTPEIALETPDESQAAARDAVVSQAEHDHSDLQLQPDDAAGRQGALPSAG